MKSLNILSITDLPDTQGSSILVNEIQIAGYCSINFNCSNLASGIYVYNLTANGLTLSEKMLLIK